MQERVAELCWLAVVFSADTTVLPFVDRSQGCQVMTEGGTFEHVVPQPQPPPPSPPPAPPPLPPPMWCDNTCAGGDPSWTNNGWCQDGGPVAQDGADPNKGMIMGNSCGYGTDCIDCGSRFMFPPSPPPSPPPPSPPPSPPPPSPPPVPPPPSPPPSPPPPQP